MERKLAAIFSTDVKGYSRLMGDDEEATIHTLKTYREVITTLIEQHHGRVVDSPGDNMLAEFASAVDAVKSAVAIQHELKTRNAELEAHRKMEFRIGLNVGDVITDEGRLYGDGVNIAARLEGLADAGGICISESVHTQVRNKLTLGYEYIGEREVKNIATPVPVYKVDLEADSAAASSNNQASSRKPGETKDTPLRWRAITLSVIAVLVVGAGVLVFRHFPQLPSSSQESIPANTSPALSLPDKPSIAVLPFTNMSNDPEQEYFSDGLTDTLITDLSKLSGLFVIARNSTFTYKGQAVKVGTVSQDLGVRYVVEGGVQKAGDRLRINAQLVDATTGGHLWAERYDRALTDLFALQDDITQQIVTALEVKLVGEEPERVWRRYTNNLDAYNSYLRGQAYYRRFTQETNAQARQMYEHALELDPTYAAAYAGLAFTYWMEVAHHWSQDPQTPKRAVELAQRAVTLDDSLPEAHIVLGAVSLMQKRHAEAIAAAERAIALDPNYAEAYAALGFYLSWADREEETIGMVEQAIRLNPRPPHYYSYFLGRAYYLLDRYEEAISVLKQGLTLNPDSMPHHLFLAVSYSELGREAEARAEMAEVLRISPNYSLEFVRNRSPYKDPAKLERLVAALRKAGLE